MAMAQRPKENIRGRKLQMEAIFGPETLCHVETLCHLLKNGPFGFLFQKTDSLRTY